MKSIIFVLFIFSSILSAEEPSFQDLGDKLVKSLSEKDLKSYQACWLTYEQALSKAKAILPEEGIPKMTEYYKMRDLDIQESYEKIQAFFDEQGIDRNALKCAKVVTPKVILQDCMNFVSFVNLEISSNKGTIEYKIDDACLFDKQWLLTDSPMKLKLGELFISFAKNSRKKTAK